MDKPITVAREEFIEALVKLVNESGLPMFAIEPILKDVAAEVKAASQKQYEEDKKQYEADKQKEAG